MKTLIGFSLCVYVYVCTSALPWLCLSVYVTVYLFLAEARNRLGTKRQRTGRFGKSKYELRPHCFFSVFTLRLFCLPTCVCLTSLPEAQGQKMGSDPLKLGLQMVMNHHTDAGAKAGPGSLQESKCSS